jgi:hypothetical protein
MIEGPRQVTDALAGDLLDAALAAVEKPPAYRGPVGRA